MKRSRRSAPILLTVLLLLIVPALAAETEGDAVTVTTAAEFRAALKDETIQTVFFKGRIEIDPYASDVSTIGDFQLDAGTKTIRPADPSSDEDRLIFKGEASLLCTSAHEGNRQSPDDQSVRSIYGRDYDGDGVTEPDMDLLMESAEGVVGWYEYHDPDSKLENGSDDPYRGMRVCYTYYSGQWEKAYEQAYNLTKGNWHRETTGLPGDDDQIVFLQFGTPRTAENKAGESDDITFFGSDGSVTVTGRVDVLGGQKLTIADGAVLTAAVLDLETMGGEWGWKDAGSSDLIIESGGKVVIHRWEGEDDRLDGPYVNAGDVRLAAEGGIILEDTKASLTFDKGAEIFCEYHPLAFSAKPLGDLGLQASPARQDLAQGSLPADTLTGCFYNQSFEVDQDTGEAGWRFSQEGPKTLLVTDADGRESLGVIPCGIEGEGQVRLFPLSAGEYRIYLYHDPEEYKEEWGGWTPTGVGTDIPGTEGLPLTFKIEASAVQETRVSIAEEEGPNGETVLSISLPSEALERAGHAFAASHSSGGAMGQLAEGEIVPEQGALFFREAVAEGWRVFLLDEGLCPMVPAAELRA